MPRLAGFLVVCVLTASAFADDGAVAVPSFQTVVEPLLTRAGCNQGACHGKGAGQNGFRLSLRGYAPEFDHGWITREVAGRRISRSDPEESLLLRKALGRVPHEGGALIAEGSAEHKTLLAWLSAGAPGPIKDEPLLRKLEFVSPVTLLKVGQEQQLRVRAEFADGAVRDVTWLTKFESNDQGTAAVEIGGRMKAARHGETAVRASYLDLVAVAVLTIPYDREVKPEAGRNNFVDDHVFRKLADLKIEASSLSGDSEFLRRAFLDTIGLPPTPEEARAFLADARPDKRARVIDALLQRPEFDDYWALQLGDLLQNRRERDHDVRGGKNVRAFHDWIRAQVAANRPWDAVVRDVLTASGKSSDNPAVGYYVVTVGEEREAHRSEAPASVAQSMLGIRIGCAKCHNHPLEKYTQDDYYHFAGFFSRMKMERQDPRKGPTNLVAAVVTPAPPAPKPGAKPQPAKAGPPVGVNQPRTNKFLVPRPLDRSPMSFEPDEDPRVKMAAWITDSKNEYFAGAMVNRMVRHFLGVGLVEPVDDLRATNPPTNPELWTALCVDFVAAKFDLRHLMRTILNSRTYQLSAATRPGNESETKYYSHYYARRMPAEVLSDTLADVTGVPDQFPGYPLGIRAVQLPDPRVKSYFLSLFGRSERVTACACERSGDITMAQLLHMENGEAVVAKIRSEDGRLAGLLKGGKSDDQVAEELFLAALSRRPTAAESSLVKRSLAAGDPREDVFRDLFWALLNSKEFAFSH